MAYIIIKTIKGRRYRYLQRSWRDGKKVWTQAISLGPAGGTVRKREAPHYASRHDPFGLDDVYRREMARAGREAKEIEEWQRKTFGETAVEREARQRQEKLDSLHEAYGLRMPGEAATPGTPPSDGPAEK